MYLTYRGVRRIIPVGDVPEETSSSAQSATDRPSTSFVPVLQDVSVSDKLSNASTETFVSSRPGCGFIEIGQYGAIPLSIERKLKIVHTIVCIDILVASSSCSRFSIRRSKEGSLPSRGVSHEWPLEQ